MFRFTIRDVLWLMVVVGMGAGWWADRWRQLAKMQVLEDIAGLEVVELFPRTLDGRVAAFRNQIALQRVQIDGLKRELTKRGHHVEIDGSNVYVDRLDPWLALPPAQQTPANSNPGTSQARF